MKRRDFLKAAAALVLVPKIPAVESTYSEIVSFTIYKYREAPMVMWDYASAERTVIAVHSDAGLIALMESRIRHAERDMLEQLTRRIYEDR